MRITILTLLAMASTLSFAAPSNLELVKFEKIIDTAKTNPNYVDSGTENLGFMNQVYKYANLREKSLDTQGTIGLRTYGFVSNDPTFRDKLTYTINDAIVECGTYIITGKLYTYNHNGILVKTEDMPRARFDHPNTKNITDAFCKEK